MKSIQSPTSIYIKTGANTAIPIFYYLLDEAVLTCIHNQCLEQNQAKYKKFICSENLCIAFRNAHLFACHFLCLCVFCVRSYVFSRNPLLGFGFALVVTLSDIFLRICNRQRCRSAVQYLHRRSTLLRSLQGYHSCNPARKCARYT